MLRFLRTRLIPSYPLLGKELRELAAQRRTYAARVGFALLLFVVFGAAYLEESATVVAMNARLGMIGHGGVLFDRLFAGLLWGVMLAMPALAAGTIAREKEQNSLVTLLITPMRPWELLLQKWASCMLSMGMLLTPALPLFAICYALGGVEPSRISLAAGSLLLAVAEVGALALACSAWCRTSLSALICCYALLLVVIGYTPLLGAATHSPTSWVAGWFVSVSVSTGTLGSNPSVAVLASLDPGNAFRWADAEAAYSFYGMNSPARLQQISLAETAAAEWPALVAIPALLLAARAALVRRAQPSGGSALLRVFRGLDRWFTSAEHRLGRRLGVELPRDRPVAWREINRRALANPRYLVRLFLPIGALATFICVILAKDWAESFSMSFTYLFGGASLAGALAMLVLGTGLLASERSEQTLGVLLTTPLSGRAILAQKQSALRRVHVLLIAVLGLIVGMRWFCRPDSLDGLHLLVMAAFGLLVPAAATWVGIAAGVLVRRRSYALSAALLAATAWCALPWLVAVGLDGLFGRTSEASFCLRNLSPMAALSAADASLAIYYQSFSGSSRYDDFDYSSVATTCAVIGPLVIWLTLRFLILLPADRLLRRGADG
jgi:ABC-type transport system involved in multi-copper enzyme maturation permease subunit